MGIFEIISAIVLIVACVFIIVVVLMKDTKTQMSQAIGGASSDNFFQKNSGRTKEAKLNKATVAATIVFFVLALGVNIINVHFGGSKKDTTSSADTSSSVVLDTSSASDVSDVTESDTSSAADATSTSSAADSTVSE